MASRNSKWGYHRNEKGEGTMQATIAAGQLKTWITEVTAGLKGGKDGNGEYVVIEGWEVGKVTLMCSTGEVERQIERYGAHVHEEGRIMVRWRPWLEILKHQEDDARCSLWADKGYCHGTCKKTKFRTVAPELPESRKSSGEDPYSIEVGETILKSVLTASAGAKAGPWEGEPGPALALGWRNGTSGGALYGQSTNRKAAAEVAAEASGEAKGTEGRWLLGDQGVRSLDAMLEDGDGKIVLVFGNDGRTLEARKEGERWKTQCETGALPKNIESVVEDAGKGTEEWSGDRKEWIAGLEAGLAAMETGAVGQQLTIEEEEGETVIKMSGGGGEAEIRIGAEKKEPDRTLDRFEINAKMLVHALRHLPGERVVFTRNGGETPLGLRPAEDDPSGDGTKARWAMAVMRQ